MKYGLSMPNFGMRMTPQLAAAMAREAEAAGWDGFFLWDHLLAFSAAPVPLVDPWITMAAIACSTTRIRFGPMVTPLPRRKPTQLARETVTLDHLSGGRLILGVGIGAMPFEWDYLGEEPDLRVRGRMLDEQLDVLTGLWSGKPFTYRGEHYRIKGAPPHEDWHALYAPPPVQSPRIPIWVGGTWPRQAPFRRGVRWDGVFPMKAEGLMTPEDVRQAAELVRRHRTAEGPFDIIVAGTTQADRQDEAPAKAMEFQRAGATWWIEDIHPWRYGLEPSDPWPGEETLERIRQGPPKG